MPAFVVLLNGCDAEPMGPGFVQAPEAGASFAAAPNVVPVANNSDIQLLVGDTVRLELGTVRLADANLAAVSVAAAPAAASLQVGISTSGSYVQVKVTSTADFDAMQIADASVTLGTAGGVRVPVAQNANGTFLKVVSGGRYRTIWYSFRSAELSSGGSMPPFSELVFQATYPGKGTVVGTLSGVAPEAPAAPAAPVEEATWSSSAPEVVSVSDAGVAIAQSAGSAVLSYGTSSARDTVNVTVVAPVVSTPLPPVASSGEFVVLPSPAVEAILGPQLRSGSSANPWPWFDQNATKRGLELCAEFPMTGIGDDLLEVLYYDQSLAHYTTYYRTGEVRALECARKVADRWAEALVERQAKGWGTTPRGAALAGLILRALDGRPELWPTIERITYYAHRDYVYKVRNLPGVYNLRDGGYALLYVAWLAQVHPDAAKRAEYREQALDGALGYFVRLQEPNGAWFVTEDGKTREQPFMVGILLEGLIEVHQMTGDEAVKQSILKSVEHLYSKYRFDIVKEDRGQGAAWRQMPYFIYPDGTVHGESKLAGGWDTNTIREGRQRNSLVVHAYGYAYHITHETKYRTWGDEIFAATYGKGQGPGADAFYGLADFRAKEYNQAYRSAGRYLAWRAM